MKKISLILLLFLVLILIGYSKQILTPEVSNINANALDNHSVSNAKQIIDKLEVYYFHRTARCYSCKTIGQYIKETMEQKYSKQIDDGVIDFRELNVELLENKEITRKFRASGSSLFINRIIDGNDNIEQDNNVWRLLSDEAKFKTYLEDKINTYLNI